MFANEYANRVSRKTRSLFSDMFICLFLWRSVYQIDPIISKTKEYAGCHKWDICEQRFEGNSPIETFDVG